MLLIIYAQEHGNFLVITSLAKITLEIHAQVVLLSGKCDILIAAYFCIAHLTAPSLNNSKILL